VQRQRRVPWQRIVIAAAVCLLVLFVASRPMAALLMLAVLLGWKVAVAGALVAAIIAVAALYERVNGRPF
jgi:hypothetical protein